MRFPGTGRGRFLFGLAAVAILAAGWARGARGAEPDVIKGTVASIRPSAIYLTEVGSPDNGAPTRDAMAVVDDATEYYDATRRVSRDDIVPGLRVIVRFRDGGEGRAAAQVRIIGGKSP